MQLYYENRNLPTNPPATLAADIARYIQMRQYLGTTVVVCDNPTAILSAARKQWFKAVRYLQRLRASTLNAEEILRLTHALMHMQNLQFTAKSYNDHPGAAAYFITPGQLNGTPSHFSTLYLTADIPDASLQNLFQKMPHYGLVVNYATGTNMETYGLQPKANLEQKLLQTWEEAVDFLAKHGIDPAHLVAGNTLQFEAMDAALDILLGVGDNFLYVAAKLQHAINRNQPFTTITSEQQKKFEAVTRLAHRVQALTPGNFNDYLSVTFGDAASDAFFLRDAGSELYLDLQAAALADASSPE